MKQEVEWIHVDDRLPVIPEGRYGISVLVVEYDSMDGPDGTWTVTNSLYASTNTRNGGRMKWFEGHAKDFDFMDLYYGAGNSDWGPTGNPVIYWAYMPELPSELKLPK